VIRKLPLSDGERAPQILVEEKLGVTLILDLLYVLEKLWKAAYMFKCRGSLDAELWALSRTLRTLFGDVNLVVKGIRQSVTKRGFFREKRKTLCFVAEYLHRNRARMRYEYYLVTSATNPRSAGQAQQPDSRRWRCFDRHRQHESARKIPRSGRKKSRCCRVQMISALGRLVPPPE
jgi:hypothetical protein